jgi:hypothetical protein
VVANRIIDLYFFKATDGLPEYDYCTTRAANMNYRIDNLTPVMYTGWDQKIEHNTEIDAPCRMVLFDFPGETELYRLQCAELQTLWNAIPDNIRGGRGSEKEIKRHSGIMIARAIDNINHKLIQFGAVYPALIAGILESDRQGNEFANTFGAELPKFGTFIPMRKIEAEVENFIYRVLSILDVCALLTSYLNANAPQKYGQQITQTEKGKVWDQVYQDEITQLSVLKDCRAYRNNFTHEVSLKLRPAKIAGQWRSVIVKDFRDRCGLIVAELLPCARNELWELIRFMDAHFALKAPNLAKLWPENKL